MGSSVWSATVEGETPRVAEVEARVGAAVASEVVLKLSDREFQSDFFNIQVWPWAITAAAAREGGLECARRGKAVYATLLR